jgi:Uma2 family endonuclease
MGEIGIIHPESRVELLNGEIIDMSPIGPFHGGVTKWLNSFFIQQAKGRWIVSVQDPVRLDDHSEPEPDLMLLKPSSLGYKDRHPSPSDVFLLIEVADSSLQYDRGLKLRAYARAAIPEVWIVNLSDLLVEMHRDPGPDGYKSVKSLRPGEKASPPTFPDVQVDISELLK